MRSLNQQSYGIHVPRPVMGESESGRLSSSMAVSRRARLFAVKPEIPLDVVSRSDPGIGISNGQFTIL